MAQTSGLARLGSASLKSPNGSKHIWSPPRGMALEAAKQTVLLHGYELLQLLAHACC
ncbi:MAG: hypothetical protein AB8B36_06635 [Prochlorococcus sp.]